MRFFTSKSGANCAVHHFVHLHTHTEYSLSDGLARIESLVDKAIADGMPGIAITDHANMFGAGAFLRYVERRNQELGTSLKPIVGCEIYVARNGRRHKSEREDFAGYHLVLLAKNLQGYHNLIKIVSDSYLEGFYGRPRTDHDMLERHHEGLICCSACIGGEVPQLILNGNVAEAERAAKWYKSVFGEDYYLELQRHKPTTTHANHNTYKLEKRVERELVKLSRKLGIKLICSNDIHYTSGADAEAQDCLLCINWGKRVDDPRRLIFTKQEWMKTTAEMNTLFSDIPEALKNTVEICNKVERYSIDHAPLVPQAALPEGIDEVEHLARLTFEGAGKRYGSPLPNEAKERLKEELRIINRNGFTSYFLMLHEIAEAARSEGVRMGLGRGATACSAVAYCLRLTQIDPIKWRLPFEQLLAANAATLPRQSFDVDASGREKLLQWIMQRYGETSVANIVTYRRTRHNRAQSDVAKAYGTNVEALNDHTLQIAEALSDVVCAIDLHSCGIAVCRGDISEQVPLACVESPLYESMVVATQYGADDLMRAGVIVIDILSLKALSIVRDMAKMGVDVENIPLDDAATFEMLCRGDTDGLFQFDGTAMQRALLEAQPDTFEALVEIYSRFCHIEAQAICYTLLAYQTAYLKANYPHDFALCLAGTADE